MTTRKQGSEFRDETPLAPDQTAVQGQMALRLRVAELAGKVAVFEFPTGTAHGFLQILPKDRPWIERQGGKMVPWSRASEVADLSDVPDYPSDLNACAAMREELSEDEWYSFIDALLGKPWTSAWDWDDVTKLVSAPAADQRRAFVVAKKLTSKRDGTANDRLTTPMKSTNEPDTQTQPATRDPINPTCEVYISENPLKQCGLPAVKAYPAQGGGWMSLCYKHGLKHIEAFSTDELIRGGQSWEGASDQ